MRARTEVAANYIAVGQKQVDWWLQLSALLFTFLSILVAIVAFVVPYFITRQLRKEYEVALQSARDAAALASQYAQSAAHGAEQILHAKAQIDGGQGGPSLGQRATADATTSAKSSSRESLQRKQIFDAQERNEWAEAEALSREFLKEFPTSADANSMLGYSLQKQAYGKIDAEQRRFFEAAIQCYEAQIRVRMTDAAAHVNLGWALSDLSSLETETALKRKLLLRSLEYFAIAKRLNPLDYWAYNNSGWSHFLLASSFDDSEAEERAKHLQLSLRDLEQAVKIEPNVEQAKKNIQTLKEVCRIWGQNI